MECELNSTSWLDAIPPTENNFIVVVVAVAVIVGVLTFPVIMVVDA